MDGFGCHFTTEKNKTVQFSVLCLLLIQECSNLDIQTQMTAFWQLEQVPNTKIYSQEEHDCEEIFNQTTRRDNDGIFIVKLPLKSNISDLGESYSIAKCRLMTLKRKLDSNPDLKTQYSSFMEKYENMGHMTPFTYSDKKQA